MGWDIKVGNPRLAGGYWSPFKIISREYLAIYYYYRKYGQMVKTVRVTDLLRFVNLGEKK